MGIPEEWLEALKSEENKRFYYIVGVRMRMNENMEPQYNCDFVIPYTSDDVENTLLAKVMKDNKLAPTPANEAIEAVGLSELNSTLTAVGFRVRANPDITVHKFNSEFEIKTKWFDDYIKSASVCQDVRQKLIESRIRL